MGTEGQGFGLTYEAHLAAAAVARVPDLGGGVARAWVGVGVGVRVGVRVGLGVRARAKG